MVGAEPGVDALVGVGGEAVAGVVVAAAAEVPDRVEQRSAAVAVWAVGGLCGDQVRQQQAVGGPVGRVVRVVGVGGGEQVLGAVEGGGLLVGVEPVADDGLGEAVQQQGVGVDAGEGVAADAGDAAAEGDPVGCLWERGEEVERDRFGGQERGQLQQPDRGRVLGGQPVQGELPACGQRVRIVGRPVLIE